MAYKNQVLHYTRATVEINFPENLVECSLCPLLETYARKQCRRTGEYIAEGYLRGGLCPLKIENEEENTDV